MPHAITRRTFLQALGASAAGVAAARAADSPPSPPTPAPDGGLIEGIDRRIIFNGRKTRVTWFHPRGCMVPGPDGVRALFTLQTIAGSDFFGPVHWMESRDLGVTWSEPAPIPGLGRKPAADGYEEGVCDTVPEFHPPTRSVLAIGHNVWYKAGKLARPQLGRWPVYAVRGPDGQWSESRRLPWDDPRGACIYTCGCAQRATLDGGDVLIPLSFAARPDQPRAVAVARCTFNGRDLAIRTVGPAYENARGRGLLEPTLARLDGRFYMTIRAEDERGYVATSDDGLTFSAPQPWTWDDGQPVVLSTTQQRWLVHSDGLFLVYTRKSEENAKVFRWRTPLYVAEMDRQRLRLIRESERIVFPLLADPSGDPARAAGMGNFHTVAAAPGESWVTAGEERSKDGWAGDTLLGRIRWRRPNRLATTA